MLHGECQAVSLFMIGMGLVWDIHVDRNTRRTSKYLSSFAN
jgi:hypothetical protein